jgi:hypothetical protein
MKNITWFNKLGFDSNPFSFKPAAFHNEFFGFDDLLLDINKKISESNILFIHGPYGTGKTTILKRIINTFKGKRRVIYYNCNKSVGSINFNRLLINAGWFFNKLFRVRTKNRILLLDEAQDLNKKDFSNIKSYFENKSFKSIILVSKKTDINLPNELKKIIGKDNNFGLGDISSDEAITLIRMRIGDLQFLTDNMVLKIFKKNKNPRAFLKNCEEVCRNAFDLDAEKVNDKHVSKFAVN